MAGRSADRGGTAYLRRFDRVAPSRARGARVEIASRPGRPSASHRVGNAATTASGCRRHRAHLLTGVCRTMPAKVADTVGPGARLPPPVLVIGDGGGGVAVR